MKDISMETMIRNSGKEHTAVQVDQHAILGEGRDGDQPGRQVKDQGEHE